VESLCADSILVAALLQAIFDFLSVFPSHKTVKQVVASHKTVDALATQKIQQTRSSPD